MAKYDKKYYRERQQKYRDREKEIGMRFRGWEQMPGESYNDFKRRLRAITKKI